MQRIDSCSIPISKATEDIMVTIKVTGIKQWGLRLWIGRQLIKMVARIMPIRVEVEMEVNYV